MPPLKKYMFVNINNFNIKVFIESYSLKQAKDTLNETVKNIENFKLTEL